MSEIIPDEGPRAPSSGSVKVAIVFFTVLLAVASLDWRMLDDGTHSAIIVAAAFTVFGWIAWIFS
jgi:hypothetical protein